MICAGHVQRARANVPESAVSMVLGVCLVAMRLLHRQRWPWKTEAKAKDMFSRRLWVIWESRLAETC